MVNTFLNSAAPALMSAAFFLLLAGRFSCWAKLSICYRALVAIMLVAVSFLPIFCRFSLIQLLLTILPVFSIGTLAVLLVSVLRRVFYPETRQALLDSYSLFLFSIWNVLLGAALYGTTLGLLPYDMYFYGYTFSWPFILTLALTLLAIYFRSRLVFIFLAYLVAWNHTLLPSPNFFDYVIDPFLFFFSIITLFSYAIRYSLKSRG